MNRFLDKHRQLFLRLNCLVFVCACIAPVLFPDSFPVVEMVYYNLHRFTHEGIIILFLIYCLSVRPLQRTKYGTTRCLIFSMSFIATLLTALGATSVQRGLLIFCMLVVTVYCEVLERRCIKQLSHTDDQDLGNNNNTDLE